MLGKLRTFAINATVMLAALSISLALAEGAVRLWVPQQLILIRPDMWEQADSVGYLHRPHVRTTVNTGERAVDFYTDDAGFRVGEDGQIEADTKVLLIGDSFMEALQVEYEQSTAGLLEAALTAATGEPVTVHNAGVGGWGPNQYLLRARTLLDQTPYDLVITAVYLGNDIIRTRLEYIPPRIHIERHRLRLPRSLASREIVDATLRPLNDFLEVRSQLYILVRTRLSTLRMRLGLAPLRFPFHFARSEADSESWQVTADVLSEIQRLAARQGASALFVLIPASYQLDPANFSKYVERYGLDPASVDVEQPNRLLGAALAAHGVRVEDVLPEFRAAYGDGVALYGRVDTHFTPQGNELLAELVAPQALELISGTAPGS